MIEKKSGGKSGKIKGHTKVDTSSSTAPSGGRLPQMFMNRAMRLGQTYHEGQQSKKNARK